MRPTSNLCASSIRSRRSSNTRTSPSVSARERSSSVLRSQRSQVHEVVLGLGEEGQDLVRGARGVGEVEPAQREVSCGELVEDHEPGPAAPEHRGVGFQAEHGGVLAHYLQGVGVEVGDGQLEGLLPEAGDEPRAHLVGGLDGEGEGEDALGRRAPEPPQVLVHPVAHELGHGVGLAGAGPGEDPGGAADPGVSRPPARGSAPSPGPWLVLHVQRADAHEGAAVADLRAPGPGGDLTGLHLRDGGCRLARNPSSPSEVSSSRSAGAP